MFLDKAGLVFPCTRFSVFLTLLKVQLNHIINPSYYPSFFLTNYTNYQNHKHLIVFMIGNPMSKRYF
jgi:hypothetical protein